MKNCIIIHGCPSNPEKRDPERRTYDKHWIPWIADQLQQKGIPTERPLMPEPWSPVYESFKQEFEKQSITPETILIGHSCGCAFLVRWLGESKQPIAKLILVAPWKVNDEGDPQREDFYGFTIDPTISERVADIAIFTSDDEVAEGKESLKMYHDAVGGEIIDLPKHGHYTLNDMGTPEFPELLDVVLRHK